MVNLNLTLVIELVLFLIFLWGTNRFILTPLLRLIDERERLIDGDLAEADDLTKTATALETDYESELIEAQRESEHRYRLERQRAIQEYDRTMAEERAQSDKRVMETRAAARAELESAGPVLEREAPELARMIRTQLGLGDTAG